MPAASFRPRSRHLCFLLREVAKRRGGITEHILFGARQRKRKRSTLMPLPVTVLTSAARSTDDGAERNDVQGQPPTNVRVTFLKEVRCLSPPDCREGLAERYRQVPTFPFPVRPAASLAAAQGGVAADSVFRYPSPCQFLEPAKRPVPWTARSHDGVEASEFATG